MPKPDIFQIGKYQIAKVRLAGKEDQLGIRTDPYQPWILKGDVALVQDLLEEGYTPWVETRRNLIDRPTPVDVSDWYFTGGTRALDSVFTRRAGVPTLRRTLTAASAVLVSNALMAKPGLTSYAEGAPVVEGETYTVSGYVSASVAGFESVVSIIWADSAGGALSLSTGDFVTGGVVGQWQRLSVTAVAPAGAMYAAPYLNARTASGTAPVGTQVWFTDGLMEVGSTVGEFFYGDSEAPDTDTRRILWEGEENASASVEQVRMREDGYEWGDRYGYLRNHNSVRGASKRGLLQPPESGLPRDLLSGIGGVGFDVRLGSLAEREELYSAVSSIDFDSMIPVDADNSELSKGVDYGRA